MDGADQFHDLAVKKRFPPPAKLTVDSGLTERIISGLSQDFGPSWFSQILHMTHHASQMFVTLTSTS